MYPTDIWGYLFYLYYVVFSVLSIVILIPWYRKIKDPSTKRHGLLFIISMFFPLVVGTVTDTFSQNFNQLVPDLAIIFIIVPTLVMVLSMKKFGYFLGIKEPGAANTEKGILSSRARSRLFATESLLIMAGSLLLFAVSYFGIHNPLLPELIYCITLIAVGILIGYLPLIFKKKQTQDKMFVLINSIMLPLFLLRYTFIGGNTVWAVAFFLILLSVALENKRYVGVFITVFILTQIYMWIRDPLVIVQVSWTSYLSRILLITLGYLIVQYVSGEYLARLHGHEKHLKEQQLISDISTNFISISNQNAHEKIDDMLIKCAPVLEFNHAYLCEFDKEYTEIKILNLCMQNALPGAFPYPEGSVLSISHLPTLRTALQKNRPLTFENIDDPSLQISEGVKHFFLRRGIQSCIAMPIVSDDILIGMLVLEYYVRSSSEVQKDRLQFLQIIANMLLDTRKKTLYEERLYHEAYYDETTNLANRNSLNLTLNELTYNRPHTQKIAVLNIDLDNFRNINDTFGHNVGDDVIKETAELLSRLLKKTVLCRGSAVIRLLLSSLCSTAKKRHYLMRKKLLKLFAFPFLCIKINMNSFSPPVSVSLCSLKTEQMRIRF